MTTYLEIDSFYTKFKNLLVSGFKASLTLESQDGEAFATLKAGLGYDYSQRWRFQDGVHCAPKKFGRSPAYYRRQVRRQQKAKRASKEEENDVKIATQKVANIDVSVEGKTVTDETNSAEQACLSELPTTGDINVVVDAESITRNLLKCITCGVSFKEHNSLKIHEDKYLGCVTFF